MRILVLDTIHGGEDIARALSLAGHTVDAVDVYHGTTPDAERRGYEGGYDLTVAPVHLDPSHPLLMMQTSPVITHHHAVKGLVAGKIPPLMVEITGAQGKTTTASALATLLGGSGVLHTSRGTSLFPADRLIQKKSITPGSLLSVVPLSQGLDWLISEISLGLTCSGDLGIITSAKTYPIASQKKDALTEKMSSAADAKTLLIAPDVPLRGDAVIPLLDIAQCDGITCELNYKGREYRLTHPLFGLSSYRIPLMLASAAAVILGKDPSPLRSFSALPGRMSIRKSEGIILIDNSNTGTNAETTIQAAEYGRTLSPEGDLTLVIGISEQDGAVCEGFPPSEMLSAIEAISPHHLIWVGNYPDEGTEEYRRLHGRVDQICQTLSEAERCALDLRGGITIILSVKTWR